MKLGISIGLLIGSQVGISFIIYQEGFNAFCAGMEWGLCLGCIVGYCVL